MTQPQQRDVKDAQGAPFTLALALLSVLTGCAMDSPEDECVFEEQGCYGNTALHCVDYHLLFGGSYRQRWDEDCGEMECVESDGDIVAFCALESEPSGFCESAGWAQLDDATYPSDPGTGCVDNSIPACFSGFIRRYVSCGDRICVVPDGHHAICALEEEPSPLCDGSRAVTCEGSRHPVCEEGFVTDFFDCAVGECEETESGAACTGT